MKKDILSYQYEELTREMESLGEKPFRGQQVYEWLHRKLSLDFEEMTNLSKPLRKTLREGYEICRMEPVARRVSQTGPTEKFLFGLSDGNRIESVWMRRRYGNSVCISSQAGCRMGCRFCASGQDGLARDLKPSEMLGQVYQIQRITGERVSNIVVMGTGEPLDNYDNFLKFVRMASDSHGLNISQRNMAVSTCGIVPAIKKLAKERLQITLALSLHAPTQEKRQKLMPIASRYPLSEVLAACDGYFEQTGRRPTFEYSLIKGVNDQPEDAEGLIRLLKGRNCHLNLILANPVKGREFRRPDEKSAADFKRRLKKGGLNATIRKPLGTDIEGACGQLRRGYAQGQPLG